MVRIRSTVKTQPGLLLQPYVVSQLGGRLVERVVEGSDVTAAEYALTSWLNVRESSTPSQLAAELGLAPTTLSAMVERLVRKKQVRRSRHPDDGRSYVLELTARGKATNARNAERLGKTLAVLRANLDGADEEILDALRRLETALRDTLELS
jgi:DNA-binding MarR family transcriptional regulator